MRDYKKLIQDILISKANVSKDIALEIVEESNENYDSDYSVVCFSLAKELKKSPQIIAEELKQYFINIPEIEYVENLSGYVNIYINKNILVKDIITEFNKNKEKFGISKEELDENNLKTILVEYSSPNIAKEFHIGHLKNTVIGAYLYRLNKFLGYNTIGINHLGDYGTQFGKLIEGYNLWKDEYDLSEDSIEKLAEIYVRINELCSNDESVLDKCRENFKKLEEGDKDIKEIWQHFVDLSLEEFNKIYRKLNVSFDEIRGESEYSDSMPMVLKELEKKNLVKDSMGAKIIDLEEEGLGIAIIQKSNESSIYLTRDIATIMYRINKYNFDECLYVVGSEQILHFRQLFKIAELMGINQKYIKGLKHVHYGLIRLVEGKMSSRKGTIVKVEGLLNDAIDKAYEKVKEKNIKEDIKNEEEIKDIASKVGIGAVIFSNLSTALNKEQIFDLDEILNYSGETGPYIQYNYVRIKNLFKDENIPNIEDIDINILIENKASYNILRKIYKFGDILKLSKSKNEPSILSNYILDLTKDFSNYYTENRILVEDKKEKSTKLYLSYIVSNIIKTTCDIMGIELPNKM